MLIVNIAIKSGGTDTYAVAHRRTGPTTDKQFKADWKKALASAKKSEQGWDFDFIDEIMSREYDWNIMPIDVTTVTIDA